MVSLQACVHLEEAADSAEQEKLCEMREQYRNDNCDQRINNAARVTNDIRPLELRVKTCCCALRASLLRTGVSRPTIHPCTLCLNKAIIQFPRQEVN